MVLLWIGIALFALALLVKKNKFFYILQMFYLWLVASSNNWNADYTNYLNGYKYMFDYHGMISEPFYWGFARLSALVGLDFQGFRYLFFFIAILILGIGIWKLTIFPNTVLALYFLYPFTIDVIQLRTMMANAIFLLVVYNIKQYAESKQRKNFFASIVFVVLATGFHFFSVAAAIVYLALLSNEKINKNLFKIIVFIVALFSGVLLFGDRINSKLVELGVVDKVAGYQGAGSNIGGYLIALLALRIAFLVICILAVYSPKAIKNEESNALHISNTFFLKCVGLLSIYALLEVTVSMEIERISRIMIMLGWVLICNTAITAERKNRKVLMLIVCLYLFVFLYIVYFRHYAGSQTWFEYAFLSIFQNTTLN